MVGVPPEGIALPDGFKLLFFQGEGENVFGWLGVIEDFSEGVDDHGVAGVGDVVAVVPYPIDPDDIGLVLDGAGL